jgi:p-aminobenzoyl-glutamate transporter AbgT
VIIGFTLLLIVWYALELPLGPGTPLFLPQI